MIRYISAVYYAVGYGRRQMLINPDHIVRMVTLSQKESHAILGSDSPDAVETVCEVSLITREVLYLCHDQKDILTAIGTTVRLTNVVPVEDT